MKLDERTRKLIAVGASVACNCHPCLEYHLGQAQSMGIETALIEEAIDAGKAVRAGCGLQHGPACLAADRPERGSPAGRLLRRGMQLLRGG